MCVLYMHYKLQNTDEKVKNLKNDRYVHWLENTILRYYLVN